MMDTRTLLLVFFIGAVSCDETLRPCAMEDLNPCIAAVTKSYISNTKGAQAAELPPDPVSSMAVAEALGFDAANPQADVNKTCSAVANMDIDSFGTCLDDVAKVCFSGMPPEMLLERLPALRTPTSGQSTKLMTKMCTSGCMKPNLIHERMTGMNLCWKNNQAAVEAMLTGTGPQCGPVGTYMTCTWENAVGCDFLESLIRLHLRSLNNVITTCKIDLPKKATQDPWRKEAMVGTASSLSAPGLIQVLFHVLIAIAAFSFVKIEMKG